MIKDAALQEILNPTWGVTKQFLEVHQVNEDPSTFFLGNSHRDQPTQTVYVPFIGQRFFLAIEISAESPWAIIAVRDHPYVSVGCYITSETLHETHLLSLWEQPVERSWSRGDAGRNSLDHKDSGIFIEPDKHPGRFSDKLDILLGLLAARHGAFASRKNEISLIIQVAQISWIGNGSIDGLHLSQEQLKKLGELNAEIDFDLYAEGKPIA